MDAGLESGGALEVRHHVTLIIGTRLRMFDSCPSEVGRRGETQHTRFPDVCIRWTLQEEILESWVWVSAEVAASAWGWAGALDWAGEASTSINTSSSRRPTGSVSPMISLE